MTSDFDTHITDTQQGEVGLMKAQGQSFAKKRRMMKKKVNIDSECRQKVSWLSISLWDMQEFEGIQTQWLKIQRKIDEGNRSLGRYGTLFVTTFSPHRMKHTWKGHRT